MEIMLVQLQIFDCLIEGIEKRSRKRLPESERRTRELLRLCRVIDSHAGLRESFPRELQLLLRVIDYGPEEAWADSEAARALLCALGGAAAGGAAAGAGAVIKRALERACDWIGVCFDEYRLRQSGVIDCPRFYETAAAPGSGALSRAVSEMTASPSSALSRAVSGDR